MSIDSHQDFRRIGSRTNAPRLVFDQPLAGQLADGLADRSSADADFPGQGVVREPGARPNVPAFEFFANQLVSVLFESEHGILESLLSTIIRFSIASIHAFGQSTSHIAGGRLLLASVEIDVSG